jgi:hypothetical protein
MAFFQQKLGFCVAQNLTTTASVLIGLVSNPRFYLGVPVLKEVAMLHDWLPKNYFSTLIFFLCLHYQDKIRLKRSEDAKNVFRQPVIKHRYFFQNRHS